MLDDCTSYKDTHVNELSYVVKVDASIVGYGNQSGLCILYKLSGRRRSERGVSTLYVMTLCKAVE